MFENELLASLESWSYYIYDMILVIGIGLFLLELFVGVIRRRIRKLYILDSLVSFSTLIPYGFIEALMVGISLYAYFGIWDHLTPYQLPINGWTIFLAILLADIGYYWMHRVSHEVRLLWVAHSVHHSSPIFNTAVAFRFSPFDPFISPIFHAPIILMGVHPMLLIIAELIVLAYQFWIHTELVGKLGFLEKFLNTPSNHRVHHGSDDKYIDNNYDGITIIWDRLFGTYQAEEEKPTYGLTRQINTVNPIKVWFYEIPGLIRDLFSTASLKTLFLYVFDKPGWAPADKQLQKEAMKHD